VRCIGERPSCYRCTRLRRRCTWTKENAERISPYHAVSNTKPVESKTSLTSTEPASTNLGIPLALLFKLVNLYFSNVYNASLLLHRPSFTRSIAEGTASKHVILSVCAMASCFYNDHNRCNTVLEEGFAHEWAQEAGRLVFSQVESPTEDNLVTFLNLTLFWYSQGQWQRMVVYEGNATCTSYVLGLGASEPITHCDSFTAELSRRRFWACFLINQFTNGAGCLGMSLENFKGVPFPCHERDFELGAVRDRYADIPEQERSNSYFAELIRLGSLWTSACRLVQDDKAEVDQTLLAIQKLDSKLRSWRTRLPDDFDLDCAYTETPTKLIQILSLHIIYHQVMCVLHSSIVPLFSLNPVAAGVCGYFQTASAQTALFHARQISSIFVRSNCWSLSQSSGSVGFVGCAAYCSCAIQLPFLWCRKSSVRESAHANIKANLEAIRAISKHWKLVAALTDYVPLLYIYHKGMGHSLADEPRALDESDLNRHRGMRIRARASILGHNEIIWSKGRIPKPGEVDVLDLDDAVEEGDGTCIAQLASTMDLTYPTGPFEVHFGSTDFHSQDLDDPSILPAVADAFPENQEPLSFLSQVDFSMSDSSLDCPTNICTFEEVFGQGCGF
ncbi:putative transcriptional regulatory protein, partial [Tolypocladium ophioglossoides CBS 100239]